ncbi:trypsin-like peptidase domain-containing protein [Phormidium sp. FACHB-592]|uniref:Trypsin-like peptidase domain-containing protein n=1 Tax=Stenomitos frigidus AS-A4 TaxID=2933935 RepID=A0ABV0KTH4_9CYAN|nr:trypsin-like peptidase domain-containing protein [Phormidium sp. FACHB-592]
MSSEELEKVVFPITSKDKDRSPTDYGTGFVIHKNKHKRETYLMTCDHVIDIVGGVDQVRVFPYPYDVEVVARGQSKGCDLAIIKVGRLLKGASICPIGVNYRTIHRQKLSLVIDGYQVERKEDGTSSYGTHHLSGTLGNLGFETTEQGQTRRWSLIVDQKSESALRGGFSGSPVLVSTSVNTKSKKVIGIAYKAGLNGESGFAIDIASSRKICDASIVRELAPFWSHLSQSSGKIFAPILKRLIQYAGHQIERQRLQRQAEYPELGIAFEWLSDQDILAAAAVSHVLSSFPELSSDGLEDFKRDDFQWEIEKYIELVYVALIDDCTEIIKNLRIPPSQKSYPESYEEALCYLKQNIPLNIDSTIASKIRIYFDYLIQSIQIYM